MIGRCESCKHWGENWSGGEPLSRTNRDRHQCLRIMRVIEITSMDEFARTPADFGCTCFEPHEAKPHCPICGSTSITSEFRPNHVPRRDVAGTVIGYDHGIPTANVTCAAGCYVAVCGEVQCAELAKAMGVPATPREQTE